VVANTPSKVAFVAGVLLASLAWQVTLGAVAGVAGARLPAWSRLATGVAGHLLVLGYAARLAVG
jgi:hypothetical protein